MYDKYDGFYDFINCFCGFDDPGEMIRKGGSIPPRSDLGVTRIVTLEATMIIAYIL